MSQIKSLKYASASGTKRLTTRRNEPETRRLVLRSLVHIGPQQSTYFDVMYAGTLGGGHCDVKGGPCTAFPTVMGNTFIQIVIKSYVDLLYTGVTGRCTVPP